MLHDEVTAPRSELAQVVATAVRAPSVHNTQPWRFRLDLSRGVLQVRADRGRQLASLDPDGRELVLSCGAAVAYAEVALAAAGLTAETALLPDPGDEDLLAEVRVRGRRDATPDEQALAAATARRATWRGRLSDVPVPDEVVDALREEVLAAGASVQELTGGTWVRGAVLHSHASAVQEADRYYHRELRAWTSRGAAAADGVPREAMTPRGRGPHSTWALREFDEQGDGLLPEAGEQPEHARVLLLGTDDDGPRGWLTAGRAFARLALRAEALDLRTSPLTQVLEVPSARGQMRRLGGGTSWPQMLVRFGYGDRAATTPRRPVEEVLEVVSGEP